MRLSDKDKDEIRDIIGANLGKAFEAIGDRYGRRIRDVCDLMDQNAHNEAAFDMLCNAVIETIECRV